MMGLLEGKKAVVFGVANDHSIAWAIARAMHEAGAEVALSHAGPAFERRVRPLAESLGIDTVIPCDVTSDDQVEAAFETLRQRWGRLDVLVHAIAFAQRDDLRGRFVDTRRDGFRVALEVSAYSLVALARSAAPLMAPDGGSIVTLSYLGAQRVFPSYNVMGVAKAALESCVRYLAWDLGVDRIRVNAISAGPIRTLSAAGVRGFRDMLRHHAELAPLRRNVEPGEVGGAAVYLSSDLARGVTGEILYVDAGYNVVGM